MLKRSIVATLLTLAAASAPALAKAETFTFTASGIGYSFNASGMLTGVADPTVAGAFDITSGSGQVNGIAMTLFTPGGTASTPVGVSFADGAGYTYDNVVYTSGLSLDLWGLLFSDGGDHTNFYWSTGNYLFANDATGANGFPITFTLTDTTGTTTTGGGTSVTPEPGSFALLGTGLLGVAGIVRRRLA